MLWTTGVLINKIINEKQPKGVYFADWGWGTTPQKSVQVGPAVCFLPCQILTNLCDFHYPISGLIQNSIPNFKPGLALHSQNMMREAT